MIFPTFRFNVERWKFNSEFKIYVSNFGNIRNERKEIIPFKVSGTGYLVVKTQYGIKQVHRLVMLTWRPVPNFEDLTVDHKNHNKRDNSLENLEWVTLTENQRRAKEDLMNPTVDGEDLDTKKVVAEYPSLHNAAQRMANQIFGNGPSAGNIKNIEKQMRNAINKGIKFHGVIWREV